MQRKRKTGRASKPKPLRGDPNRQATEAIGAYRYQVLQSAHKWLELDDEEHLFLEGAEDLEVFTPRSVTAVQIKSSPRPITLNSAPVRRTIASYWQLRRQNEKQVIYFRLLTRAPAGVEQGHPFGAHVKGIELWRQAARDHRKAEQLLPYLLRWCHLPSDLRSSLESSESGQVLSELLDRIAWDTAGPEPPYVEESLRRKLILHGDGHGVPPREAAAVKSRILDEVWVVASRKGDRWLDKARFLEIFAEETMVSLPRSQAQRTLQLLDQLPAMSAGLLMGGAAHALGLGQIAFRDIPPLGKDVEPREHLVAALASIVEQEGLLCLSGSVGMGKTTLAKLLIQADGDEWLWASFTGYEAKSVANELSRLGQEIEAKRRSRNLVFDDLDIFQAGARALEPAMGAMLYTVFDRGGRVIITSHKSLPARFLRSLRLPARCNQHTPSMSREEITLLAKRLGCPDELATQWAGVVELHTQGHPQLVHARLYQLRSKEWPGPESDDLFHSGPAIDQERTDVRQSLLRDLHPEERELIYRLSLAGAAFRRDHAIAIGALTEGIPRPGEVVDRLAGPWIEELGGGYLRLSALLGQAGIEEWSAERVRELRAGIATSMLGCRPVTTQEAQTALMLAFAARAPIPLLRVILPVLEAPEGIRNALFKNLWWVGALALDTATPVFPEDHVVNFMLRLLQFKIVAQEDPRRAAVVAERWQHEITPHEPEESYDIQRHLLASTVLLSVKVPLTAPAAISYLLQLGEDWDRIATLRLRRGDLRPPPGQEWIAGRFDPLADLIACVLIRCTTPQFLRELLDSLKNMPAMSRQRILSALDVMDTNARLLIDSVWITEAKSATPDWAGCLKVFEKAMEYAADWGSVALLTAAARGSCIILDEYLQDAAGALALLTRTTDMLGKPSAILEDSKATILLHQGRHSEALGIWQSVLPEWEPQKSHMDLQPVFACRNAGIAAARLEQWSEAGRLFLDGAERSKALGSLTLVAGLLADAGFALFKAGRHSDTVRRFEEALSILKETTGKGDEQRWFGVSKRVGHALIWLASQFRPSTGVNLHVPSPGFCSDQELTEAVLSLPRTPVEFSWLHLAQIEYDLQQGTAIFKTVEGRFGMTPLIVVRFFLGELSVMHAFRELTFEALPERALRLAKYSEDLAAHRARGRDITEGDPNAATPFNMVPQDPGLVVGILFAALVVLAGLGRLKRRMLDLWRRGVASVPAPRDLLDWTSDAKTILWGSVGGAAIIMTRKSEGRERRKLGALKVCWDGGVSPNQTFYAGALLVDVLGRSPWSNMVGDSLSAMLSSQWLGHAKSPATLCSPGLTVQTIQASCQQEGGGMSKAARILLAAQNAVDIRLPREMLQALRSLATV